MKNYEVDLESRHPIKLWTRGVPVEDAALHQLRNVAALPFIHKHVAVMPDVHFGKGATIGSVVPTAGAIIPAAVGVDIGCGMVAAKTQLVASDLPDDLKKIRSAIEVAVPHGRTNDGGIGDRGAWHDPPLTNCDEWEDVPSDGAGRSLATRFSNMCSKHPKIYGRVHPKCHLGTLGTGNHFVEVCLDEDQAVWVMLHSGSRGVGAKIGNHFISLAKEEMQRWFIHLPDADLSYLAEGSQHFDDYVEAVSWAQDYAAANRKLMLSATLRALSLSLGRPVQLLESVVQCHHNYVSREKHFGREVMVTRKGAVRARAGELGIVPGSMGTRSFIVRGKGNPDSFCSCSHGAGRRMSRTEAKKKFSVEDHVAATSGVECKKDASVVDETPGAYKDVEAVMAAQSDLVEVVHTLKQVVCVKG